jgi:hypothetical protein
MISEKRALAEAVAAHNGLLPKQMDASWIGHTLVVRSCLNLG